MGSTISWVACHLAQMDKEDKEKAAQEQGAAAAKPDPVSELRWVGEPAAADATIDVTAEAVPEEAEAAGPAAADAAGEKALSSPQGAAAAKPDPVSELRWVGEPAAAEPEKAEGSEQAEVRKSC